MLIIVFAVEFYIPSTSAYIALVPGRTLPCVWNLITAGFLTTNVVTLIIDVVALLLLARLVEPVYGSKEFLKFLFIVDLATCCSVFLGVYIMYAYTTEGKLLYTEFHGFHGIAAGLLVAVKQILGDQEAKLFGVIQFNTKYIPITVIFLASAAVVALQQYQMLPFMYLGAYSAWIYLRFFQHQQETGTQGDASDAFKFSGFFPPFLAPVIDPLATTLGFVFRLRHAAPQDPTTLQVKPGTSMLGSDAADANRRRERGAKALEERLGMKQQQAGDLEEAAPASVAVPTQTASSSGSS